MRVNQWPNGAPVVVFVLPDQSELHRTFTQKVLSMFPHQLRRNWDRYQYSGTGISPTEVKSPKEMIEKVIATPGAIGYADERFIDERVRILDVK